MQTPRHSPVKSSTKYNRRQFLRSSTAIVGLAWVSFDAARAVARTRIPKYRAAVIGHTGRGDYGHGLDSIFTNRADVELVAVADPVAEGRAQAAAKNGAPRHYADYRKMLEIEKPDLVSVAPRWTDQHHAMALAALQNGAHVFMEKPFTRTLAEGDELLSVAARTGRRIAVAHQLRLAPEVLLLKEQFSASRFGDLLEMHAVGKQDRRAGGEDLIVLGVHLLDLMRFFGGDPEWCTARVLERGQPISRSSGHPATEEIGPVAGDELFAHFAFASGVNATFTSCGRLREVSGPWGMTLVGSKGMVRIVADTQPRIYSRKDGAWGTTNCIQSWEVLKVTADGTPAEKPSQPIAGTGNQRIVNDWFSAISTGRQPTCSGESGLHALEMAHAVLEAGIQGKRVAFPLANREHPLEKKAFGN